MPSADPLVCKLATPRLPSRVNVVKKGPYVRLGLLHAYLPADVQGPE